MYYPYLRAKQFELKALREFSEEHPSVNSITPILEPVKIQPNALNMAVKDMFKYDMHFALILNPVDGDFKHDTVPFESWLSDLELIGNDVRSSGWIPAFDCSRRQMSSIPALIEKYNLNGVMIVFKSCMDVEDPIVSDLINNPKVEYVVNAFGTTISRRLKTRLVNTGKKIIRLDDCFHSRLRNADYALDDDEFFSEEPFYYKEDEGFDGFSDYTTLPSSYVDGGMLPYALAIHLSYKKNEDQLYVHHFVSDNNETNNDIRRKFKEAASKVDPFYADKMKTPSVEEIISKAEDSNGYPGLGYLKKLSVKNHLELIVSII